MPVFQKSPKYAAALIVIIIYFIPLFPYAMGYSGFTFSLAACADSLLYLPLFTVPLIAFYILLCFFLKEKRSANFLRFEKYTGQTLTGVLVYTFVIMLLEGSAGSLSYGYWLSVLSGLIIIFERRLKQTAFNLKRQQYDT